MVAEVILSGAAKGFAGTMAKLAASHAARILVTGPDRVDKVRTNLTPHIEATFRRCISIKTLLNQHEPVDFLSIYTTQMFSSRSEPIDHYSLVEIIRHHKNNVIVTGTGGSGKSMFMRYLWLSLFEYSDGRVPIYVELRSMNSASSINLEQYLHYTLTQGESSISETQFKKYLVDGDFIVILDGFDELSSDRKDSIQSAIITLSETYKKLKIVLSSRPDEGFFSWPSFIVYNVDPLERKDVLELVDKAQFDQTAKARFIRKIKEDGLFERHRSFLSNPLLASMMLLTFSYNYDIPEKMHLFYDQAFDALYQRHDSHKPGGYKREFKAKLSEDHFKRLLSYFSLISYYEEKFEFDREEILDLLRKAIKVDGSNVDPSQLLIDFTQCVCLIILDGAKYTFSHRSFQEYFAAYCLAYVTTKNFEQIVGRFAARPKDQAVTLLADMNPELFRERYLLPESTKYENQFQIREKEKDVRKFLLDLNAHFGVHFFSSGDDDIRFSFSSAGDLRNFYELLTKLARKKAVSKRTIEGRRKLDIQAAKRMRQLVGDAGAVRIEIAGDHAEFKYTVSAKQHASKRTVKTSVELDAAFRDSAMHDFIVNRLKEIAKYISEEERLAGKSSNAMKEIFEL